MGIIINHYTDPYLTNQYFMESRRCFFVAHLTGKKTAEKKAPKTFAWSACGSERPKPKRLHGGMKRVDNSVGVILITK